MKKSIFTDTMIRKLKPEGTDYTRSEGNGFSIRVMPSGVKTWLYIYAFDGKRRKFNLGNYPDVTLETARAKFEDAKRKVKNGIDPMTEKKEAAEERRKAPTISTLIEDYIDRYAKRFKKSWEEDKRILDKEVLPVWGKRKAADIRKRDVLELLEKIVIRPAPVMANNTFKIMRKMFNWAVEQDILQASPAFIVKLPSPKADRDRVLTADEIKTLWDALDTIAISKAGKWSLKLVLLTAQRPGEVTGMHTSEIDGDWWTIPVDRAKNGKAHRVFLTASVKAIIAEAIAQVRLDREIPADKEYEGYIFPCPHLKKQKPMERHALSRALARNFAWPVTDAKGNPLYDKDGKPATENRFGIDHFTPHDLRRTAATFMAQSGEMDEVIDAILNHTKQGVIKVYNQYRYDTEKQKALETWERKLTSIISGSKTNVVSINSGRKAA